MIKFPELQIRVELPEAYNDAGFNPFFAKNLLEQIAALRLRVGPKSTWQKVPPFMILPQVDHIDIVLQRHQEEDILNLKLAEFGSLNNPAEAIVRQSISLTSARLVELYKLFRGQNEAF